MVGKAKKTAGGLKGHPMAVTHCGLFWLLSINFYNNKNIFPEFVKACQKRVVHRVVKYKNVMVYHSSTGYQTNTGKT